MSVGYPVRMVQLGLVPPITRAIKATFPKASASLWQRQAKRTHRRIVAAAPELRGDSGAERRAAAVYTIAALLVAFHENAPDDVDLDDLDFAGLVEIACSSPITAILLSGADPFRDDDARELAACIADDGGGIGWRGEVRAEGSAGSPEGLRFDVKMHRCGLLDLCVSRKRLYLLRHLCLLEEALAGMSGCSLAFGTRIAYGAPACELTISR